MFCKHNYETIDKTILESAYEQTESSPTTRTNKVSNESLAVFFRKKLILILKCPKCKKIKKIVEVNP